MALTRILNNQVTDASAGNAYLGINAAAKLQDYSITAGKLGNSLVYASDFTVTGNLDVQGATTTIDTYNVVIEDPLLLLAKDQTGAPAFDIGFIGERGSSTNIAFVWDEAAGEFVTAFTSSALTNTTITITSYANFHTFDANVAGNLTVIGTTDITGNVALGNLSVTGLVDVDGNVTVGNLTSNNDITTVTLTTTGNAVIGGNLRVEGNLIYINVEDLTVSDPFIIIGTGPNGTPIAVDDGYDRGIIMEYYKSATAGGNAVYAWDNISGNMFIASNVITAGGNTVTSIVEWGTLNAGNLHVQSIVVDEAFGNGNIITTYGVATLGNLVVPGTSELVGKTIVGNALVNGANTANAALAIGATTSMLIPVGNTAQRPSTSISGMIRFNTSTDSLEYYDNDSWTSAGTTFTIVTADSFVGNGVANTFTLSGNSTTAATVVSINGIVQIPTTSYSVSGNVLTFTEAPEVSDVIDARLFVTTQTVTGITNASGNASIEALDSSAAMQLTGNLLPSANLTYNLGGPTAQWNDLYLSGSSIYIGDVILKASGGNLKVRNFDDTADAGVEGTFYTTSTTAGNLQIGLNHIEATNVNGDIELRPNGTGIILANSAIVLNSGIRNGAGNGVGNIGNSTAYFNTVFAKATSAQYADLAEMYDADAIYEPGTVLCFGGIKEVTLCADDSCRKVAGVVSTNPSYIMNAGLAGDTVVAVALTGRVPTKVTGSIRKGDMLVAAGDGRARAEANPATGSVIGKALADFDGADGVIEVVVGRV